MHDLLRPYDLNIGCVKFQVGQVDTNYHFGWDYQNKGSIIQSSNIEYDHGVVYQIIKIPCLIVAWLIASVKELPNIEQRNTK